MILFLDDEEMALLTAGTHKIAVYSRVTYQTIHGSGLSQVGICFEKKGNRVDGFPIGAVGIAT